MSDFSKGKKLNAAGGGQIEIIEKLGEGGQGAVYRVKYGGKEMALKWYFAKKLHDEEKFYTNIENNIKKGSPSSSFLWPQEITERQDGSFGYLMDLRPPEYKDFSQFLLAKVRFSSIRAAVNAALEITAAFMALHRFGLSYQDLNDGNFFVNPANGAVLICDNDNVSEYGESSGIAGKCRYMAPEVVTNKAKPSAHTDRFSLAVILYMLFFLNHPLEGAALLKKPCLTEEIERKYYGETPLFVWDEKDESNRPVKGIHTNELMLWPLFPQFVRDLFLRAFGKTAMIGDVDSRVLETEWRDMLINLRGLIAKCPHCGGESFAEPDKENYTCLNCHQTVRSPLFAKFKNRYHAALFPSVRLYDCHTTNDSNDFKKVTGEVVASKKNPNMLGLRNRSGREWTATLPNGVSKTFADGEVIKLGRGLKIDFANGNTTEII